MEPKKIKKLTLQKEIIANLTNDEMAHQKGGSWFFCDESGLNLDCIWSAVAMGACSAATGCDSCLQTHCGSICNAISVRECPTVDYWTCGQNNCA